MRVSCYKFAYDKAQEAMTALNSTRVSTTSDKYFPSELSREEAENVFRLLWTVGFMLSVRPEDVKHDVVGTPYGRFFKDDMAYRVTRLRGLIGDLRNEGIAL